MLTDVTLRLLPKDASDPAVWQKAALSKAGCVKANDMRIIRRSIDARQRQPYVNLTVRIAFGDDQKVEAVPSVPTYQDVSDAKQQVVIVGAGPAGLFAALKALQLGVRPIVLERGADVDRRRLDLASMSRSGIVNPESNYSFGEGGAGAYSDGKLYTRSKKRGNVEEVLSLFCHHGASPDILVDAHPHIGSDRLPGIIRNMRETIIAHGGEVRFHSRVDGLMMEGDEVKGVKLADDSTVEGPVILATGHSARDVYRWLHETGVELEAKGIAVGTRLEHPQHLIDQLQYHSKEGRGQWLPPAEYSYVCQSGGRGVYSFCMCPGGIVVPAATGPEQCVVNGMSPSNRGSRWANSGMVVEIHPGDFPQFSSHGPLEMMALQEWLEKRFRDDTAKYPELNALNAPAQCMTDFVAGRQSKSLPRSSYAPGVHAARIDKLLPEEIASRLKEGFTTFGKRSKGFLTKEALMIGLESRTSSPVRIPREAESLRHIRLKGLFPAGEGAGYAGGIVSAAIDGMRCAESVAKQLTSEQ